MKFFKQLKRLIDDSINQALDRWEQSYGSIKNQASPEVQSRGDQEYGVSRIRMEASRFGSFKLENVDVEDWQKFGKHQQLGNTKVVLSSHLISLITGREDSS